MVKDLDGIPLGLCSLSLFGLQLKWCTSKFHIYMSIASTSSVANEKG